MMIWVVTPRERLGKYQCLGGTHFLRIGVKVKNSRDISEFIIRVVISDRCTERNKDSVDLSVNHNKGFIFLHSLTVKILNQKFHCCLRE